MEELQWWQREIMRIVQDCAADGKKLMLFVPSRGKASGFRQLMDTLDEEIARLRLKQARIDRYFTQEEYDRLQELVELRAKFNDYERKREKSARREGI